MNSEIKPIYEFVLWENCNNNCEFCFLKNSLNYQDKLLNDEEKCKSLDCTLDYIINNEFETGSHILIAGGELFFIPFDSKLYDKFSKLINLIIDYIKQGKFNILYINTNLLYKDLSQVYSLIIQPFIDAGLVSHLHFTTSYDPYGRYKSEEDKGLFFSNLKKITEDYKDIQDFFVYVNCILTKPFCQDILNETFNHLKFITTYNNKVYINYLPYIPFSKALEPSDNLIYQTLSYMHYKYESYFKQYITLLLLDQKRTVLDYSKSSNTFLNHTSKVNPECHHLQSFTKYRDDGSCILCKFQKIKDVLL